MDNRNDIREFLTSRRERLTPQEVGLPDFGGRRRVKGLRREEVALLAGMSTEYYVRLERGNGTGVSEAVLNGISRALRLDEAEHAHLYDPVRAANQGGEPAPPRGPPRPPRPAREPGCRARPPPRPLTPAAGPAERAAADRHDARRARVRSERPS